MSNQLLLPVTLRFSGKDTDNHIIDGELFGKSITGTSKLYNSALHLFYSGQVPAPRTQYKIRTYTNAVILEGSVTYSVWAAMVLGEMAVYPKLWCDLADLVVPDILKAVYCKLTKRDDTTKEIYSEIFEKFCEEREKERRHAESMARMGFNAVLGSQHSFLQTIERMAEKNRGNAIQSVAPIGSTANYLEHKRKDNTLIKIDEPSADVIRSKDELEITDLSSYIGKVVEADKFKKSCRILLKGTDKPVNAKISDPQIEKTGNIYTHALHQDFFIEFSAKATLKEGEIYTLYIIDAKKA